MCCCCAALQGYLTLADLYTFFREVHGLWVAMGEYADLDIYDVLDEVHCCCWLQWFVLSVQHRNAVSPWMC
jgi:hypothetical protein